MIVKILNVLATLMLIGVIMIVTGLLSSGSIEKMSYLKGMLSFSFIVCLAVFVKNLIGWLGIEFKIPFLDSLHYSRMGIWYEFALIIILILLLPLTGNAGA